MLCPLAIVPIASELTSSGICNDSKTWAVAGSTPYRHRRSSEFLIKVMQLNWNSTALGIIMCTVHFPAAPACATVASTRFRIVCGSAWYETRMKRNGDCMETAHFTDPNSTMGFPSFLSFLFHYSPWLAVHGTRIVAIVKDPFTFNGMDRHSPKKERYFSRLPHFEILHCLHDGGCRIPAAYCRP